MKGKLTAFGDFRDVLADTIASGMPELREDVARVVAATTAPRPTATTAAGLPGSGDGDGAARTEQTAAATTAGAAGHTTS